MKRVLFGVFSLAIVSAATAVMHGQGIIYLKASNPRADARLGFGSALTGRTLVMSGDGKTIAVAAPDESNTLAVTSAREDSNARGHQRQPDGQQRRAPLRISRTSPPKNQARSMSSRARARRGRSARTSSRLIRIRTMNSAREWR